MICQAATLLAYAALLATASPVAQRRAVTELDEAATKEAHPRDDTATRAFSNVQILTADGKCLFVDKLSGDFRANLTPVQVGDCAIKDSQGWDVITAGKHNDQANTMLVVSSLTQACFNFDPRRKAGDQVNLFSCGGRAAGEGLVTDSQLFALETGAGPLTFQPRNAKGKCFAVRGEVVDVADCDANDKAHNGGNNGGDTSGNVPVVTIAPGTTSTSVTATPAATTPPATGNGNGNGGANGGQQGQIPAVNPTSPVPVSRAGGTLNPTAAAEANAFDSTATRVFTKAAIRAPDGRCLSVDPTAGDFRQNLIPVALAACDGTANQQWDVVSKGKHNDGRDNGVLVVSSLTNGCVSTDGRRADGDTVTVFSCGGRAAGEGETNAGQLVRVFGDSFLWSPVNDEATCVVPGGQGRLVTAACKGDGSETYTIVA
ncbi:ricin-type beta-trefoil lectin domain-containing protein [Colletotrichum zoysiae]|uniref:Ricin-type beta-trefoil lectin domain-containing protein n=1 Tax=Colletotrichum zoysiae TaxID=1216348 RepID=A0AAD9HU83_9PEZI|nr:ricin-type beta-trefoil lectin domain-containing protein [Colletotrichum zoysiae]